MRRGFRCTSPTDTEEQREERDRNCEARLAERDADPFYQLLTACDSNDLKTIQSLIDGGVDLSRKDTFEATPLMRCLQTGRESCRPEVCTLLIRNGAPIDVRDVIGPRNTPLHYAVAKDLIDVAALLIERGAPLNVRNGHLDVPFGLVNNEVTAEAMLRTVFECGKHANEAALLLKRFPQVAVSPGGLASLEVARARRDATWIRLLSPEEAETFKEAERNAISQAAQVFVLSTRFRPPSSHPYADPLAVSDYVKRRVEDLLGPHAKCFDPNRDNVALEGGDELTANGVWLKTWRTMLTHAQQTNGRMIRLDFSPAGLSPMQEAETDMAQDKGVPVTVVEYSFEGDLGAAEKAAIDMQLSRQALEASSDSTRYAQKVSEVGHPSDGGRPTPPAVSEPVIEFCSIEQMAVLQDERPREQRQVKASSMELIAAAKACDHVRVTELLQIMDLYAKGPWPRDIRPVDSALVEAASIAGGLETVSTLLAAGADVNAAEPANAYTALMQSACAGHSDVVHALLAAKANVNAANANGQTALSLAAQDGHLEVVRTLRLAGADTAATDFFGRTAAEVALTSHHPKIFAFLDPPSSVARRQELIDMELRDAAKAGDRNRVSVLLKAGADVNASDAGGHTALVRAAEGQHTAIARALIEALAEVNTMPRDGYTALMHAAIRGDARTVRLLRDSDADVSLMGGHDRDTTAAQLALNNHHPEVNALIDREGAHTKGTALRLEFAKAKLVHVLSTRYARDESQREVSSVCEPRAAAATLKRVLEADDLVLEPRHGFVDEQRTTFPGIVKVLGEPTSS